MSTRRNILKGAAAIGALGAFAAGYAEPVQKVARGKWSGEIPRDNVTGNAPDPEYRLDTSGTIELNPDQAVSYAMCIGCTTMCGVRVRVGQGQQQGSACHRQPLQTRSAPPSFFPMKPRFGKALFALGQPGAGNGMLHRSTACGRGNAVLDQLDNPRRVLRPLKRVGPRGSGQWETISFEQLVEEVVEGGDLFGEGKVAGLREIRDLKTPINPDAPELGPRANGVVMLSSVNDGRDNMNLRWLKQGYGSTNYARHGSYCGGSYRSGSGAMFGDVKKMPHAKPDFEEAEFILFIGTAPRQRR